MKSKKIDKAWIEGYNEETAPVEFKLTALKEYSISTDRL